MMAFVVAIPLVPAGGWGTGGAGNGAWDGLTRGLLRTTLPAITLALFFLAYIARLARSSTR